MCLTIPAKVLSVEEGESNRPVKEIVVEDSRGRRRVRAVDLPDLKAGDWVLYTLDLAVQKVSEEEAREIVDLLEPKRHIDVSRLDKDFLAILRNASTRGLEREEIVRLLKTEDPVETEALLAEANTVRQAALRDFFCIHGIIEFSSHCANNCFYCGLRNEAGGPVRYRMTKEEIVEVAVEAVEGRGYKLIVLQSGDDFGYSDDDLETIVREIRARCRVFIFASVGERRMECYGRLKAAGASGVLFRFETSSEEIFRDLHPGGSLKERLAMLKEMKGLGFYLATGFLVGLPGQGAEEIASDILLTKKLGAQMVTLGPFVPADGTPMAGHPAGSADMVLKATAVCRLLMPKAKIPVTTALETIESEEGRRRGLSSGANSLMFNLTPERYRDGYLIYPNKYHGNEALWEKYGLSRETLSYRMLEEKLAEAFE